MFCSKCGREILILGSKFCPGCGATLPQSPPQTPWAMQGLTEEPQTPPPAENGTTGGLASNAATLFAPPQNTGFGGAAIDKPNLILTPADIKTDKIDLMFPAAAASIDFKQPSVPAEPVPDVPDVPAEPAPAVPAEAEMPSLSAILPGAEPLPGTPGGDAAAEEPAKADALEAPLPADASAGPAARSIAPSPTWHPTTTTFTAPAVSAAPKDAPAPAKKAGRAAEPSQADRRPAKKLPAISYGQMYGIFVLFLLAGGLFFLYCFFKPGMEDLRYIAGVSPMNDRKAVSFISIPQPAEPGAPQEEPGADETPAEQPTEQPTEPPTEPPAEPTAIPQLYGLAVQPDVFYSEEERIWLQVNTPKGGNLYMRTGPDTSYADIDSIPYGEVVTRVAKLESNSSWIVVNYNGKYGWVCVSLNGTEYLRPL